MCDDTKFILTVTVVAPPSRPADHRVTQAVQTFWEHSVYPFLCVLCAGIQYIYRGTSPKIVPTSCARFAHLTFDIFCKSSQFGQFTF